MTPATSNPSGIFLRLFLASRIEQHGWCTWQEQRLQYVPPSEERRKSLHSHLHVHKMHRHVSSMLIRFVHSSVIKSVPSVDNVPPAAMSAEVTVGTELSSFILPARPSNMPSSCLTHARCLSLSQDPSIEEPSSHNAKVCSGTCTCRKAMPRAAMISLIAAVIP